MFARNHVIICGLGLLGPEIAARFRENGRTVVVIEKDPENPNPKL
jgi:Trk K+ transport system NAD-binding subunit